MTDPYRWIPTAFPLPQGVPSSSGGGSVEVGPKGTARPDSYTLDLARRPAVWARLPEHGHTPRDSLAPPSPLLLL